VSGAVVATGAGFPFGFGGSLVGFSSHVRDHIVRVGLNYRLGDPAVVAKY
jgi:hypothetical protein